MPELAKPYILYAEDDYDDFDALKDALQQVSQNYRLSHAKNGEEAIEFFKNDTLSKPCLVVLDLNMPVMDGKEVLVWLKQHKEYKDVPVMIFTTSSREEDIKLCQSHGCSFFRKPTLYRDLLHIVQVMLNLCDKSKS